MNTEGFGDVHQTVMKTQQDLYRVQQAIHVKPTDGALCEGKNY